MDFSHPDVRPAAVAGAFYPGQAAALAGDIDRYLMQAGQGDELPPKAIIVPHAGYIYSGPVAAAAYARIAPLREQIRRVVLIGPAHRLWVAGLAVPAVQAFATPLGEVPLDRTAIDHLTELPFVEVSEAAHAAEHSLEVQLPFLQRLLTDFSLVPVLAGGADGAQVAAVLERLWGGPETLVVISSDLSHYHSYARAQQLDAATCATIEALQPGRLTPEDACGCRGVDGLLLAAKRHDLRPHTVDLRNSGDTAGPRDQVVGYGAWVFAAGDRPSTDDLDEAERQSLLTIAGGAVRAAAHGAPAPDVALTTCTAALRSPGATFVTVQVDGALRGCLGSLLAHRPLARDVAAHAYAAASEDPRFVPVAPHELVGVALEVAVLGAPEPMRFRDEADLIAQLRPGRDGLIFEAGSCRGTFLPKVWEHLPEPTTFLAQLKRKAGLTPDYWSDDVRVARYATQSFAAPLAALPARD